jgi:hypothetical protein
VALPTGERVAGTVATVATILGDDRAGGSQTLAVDVVLDDADAAEGFDQAPVIVRVTTPVATGVLAVPVSAIVEPVASASTATVLTVSSLPWLGPMVAVVNRLASSAES